VALGPTCLGLAARWARGSVMDRDGMGTRDDMDGTAVDGLAVADLPLRLGRVTVRPGAGVGAGWVGIHSTSTSSTRRPSFDQVGFRAEARLAVDVRLGRRIALEVAAAGGAGGSLITDDHTTTGGGQRNRTMSMDRGLVPTVHAGVGLRFGGGL
jgi:hypothetical protein